MRREVLRDCVVHWEEGEVIHDRLLMGRSPGNPKGRSREFEH
ncbi:hypothetical protein [Paenarthrobacter sp. NPDC090522]